MIDQIRGICRKLLEEGTVQVVIGYGQRTGAGTAHPLILTDPASVDGLIWSRICHHNLVAYLTRAEIKALGRAAVVIKACDERALIVLQREAQIDRKQIFVIGVSCDVDHMPAEEKCGACTTRTPRDADVVVGNAGPPACGASSSYEELDRFLEKTPAERMEYWQRALQRCTRCYACRQVCPLCYCQRCIVDRNQPVRIDPSASMKGNFAWHVTRAFHLAGRCVGCDACVRACPAGIDLRLLNLTLSRAAEEDFGYRAGEDREAPPLIGAYSSQDQESFIQ